MKKLFLILFMINLIFWGCKKEEPTNTFTLPPSVTTAKITNTTETGAVSGGTITSFSASSQISARGVCWSISATPTVADSKTSDGTGTGTFTSTITGLTANTKYYVRAYATTSTGTSYGNAVSFTTNGTVTDIDGNVYHTISIGDQVWMVENLKTTKLNDGTALLRLTDNLAWSTIGDDAYCYYNNDTANKSLYGAMYNWYAVSSGKLCPAGWHVPTDAEWTTLTNYLYNNKYAYSGYTSSEFAKAMAATSGWTASSKAGDVGNDQASNNTSGFSALPGGTRFTALGGGFSGIGTDANWWTSTFSGSTNALYYKLTYNSPYCTRYMGEKSLGLYVRCIKD